MTRPHMLCLAFLFSACGPASDDSAPDLTDAAPSDGLGPVGEGGPEADAANVDGCTADVVREIPLDGPWIGTLRTRRAGAAWGPERALGRVAVPGWIFPFDRFPTEDAEAELHYTRELVWPAEWACANPGAGDRVLLEFDSADHRAVVRLGGVELGRHTGYLGRFAVPVTWGAAGALEVTVADAVQAVDARGGMEALPHDTVQGADTGGWGVNPLGLPGSVRLRLVRGVAIHQAYAVPVARKGARTTVAVALQVDPGAVGLEARAEVVEGDARLARATVPVTVDAGGQARFELPVEGLAVVPAGGFRAAHVTLELLQGGRIADRRTVPLLNRIVSTTERTLTVNDEPHFARGAAIHHGYRFLPFDDGYTPGVYVAVDGALESRYRAALAEAAAVGVGWLRPGHLLPDPLFRRVAREQGLLLSLDFPLHWNTDYGALPPDEIARQFDEFLWTAAGEPAAAIVSTHNEAEIADDDPAELATTREVIDSLLARARDVAPHLLAVGCSGCGGTAQFPENPAYPVDDVVADVHGYFGSWWQPHGGFAELPERVAGLRHPSLPVFWSEMGNGWFRHYVYLAALGDDLEPNAPAELVTLRGELESWLRGPDGRALSLRRFYDMVYCDRTLGVPTAQLAACAAGQGARRSDPEVIAWARAHFMADRLRVEGPPADPVDGGLRVAAHWLAAQIFESRWQWSQQGGFLGQLAWERGENGYPFLAARDPRLPPGGVLRAREIIAAANAPVAAALRPVAEGVEVRLVNDGPARTLSLRLRAGDAEVASEERPVDAAGGARVVVPANRLAGREGQVLRLQVTDGAAAVAEAVLVLPGR